MLELLTTVLLTVSLLSKIQTVEYTTAETCSMYMYNDAYPEVCYDNRSKTFYPDGSGVEVGTVCVYEGGGTVRRMECSASGQWVEKMDGSDNLTEQTVIIRRLQRPKLKRKKRFTFWNPNIDWCVSPDVPPTASVIVTDGTATYTCKPGYSHTGGDLLRTCTLFLGWSGTAPTCAAAECGNPENLPTSDVDVTNTTEGGYATYVCITDYTHNGGNLTRICQPNGVWSGTEPTCSYDKSCTSSPCLNGGNCTNIPDSFNCTCAEGFQGSMCEQEFLLDRQNEAAIDILPETVEVKADLLYSKANGNGGPYNKPNLIFRCDFISPVDVDDYNYYVYWYINGVYALTTGPSGQMSQLILHENDVIDKGYGLGVTIQCQLRAAESAKGPVVSEGFYAGIKIHTKVMNMIKSGTGTIIYEPTVPIGCAYKDISRRSKCKPQLTMIDIEKSDTYTCSRSEIAVKRNSWCGNDIDGSFDDIKYDNWVSQNYSMEIKATSATYNDKAVFHLLLSMGLANEHAIWKNYETDVATIYIDDTKAWQYKRCSSVVDPHMTTFSGLPYENQERGDFLLYNNTKYKIQVQERTASCNANRAYCTCAVSVRAGGDIFTVNLCSGSKVIDFLSCKENILDVRLMEDRLTYQVHTPIGTYVEIRMRPHPHPYYRNFLNVYVYMSPKDIGNVEGLCGSFDGNDSTSDLVHRRSNKNDPIVTSEEIHHSHRKEFTRSWKIDNSESYLIAGNTDPELYDEDFNFCVCEAAIEGNKQNNLTKTAICSKSEGQLCSRNLNFGGNIIAKRCNIGKKRSTSSHLKELWRRINLGETTDYNNYHKRSDDDNTVVPTKDAIDECSNFLQDTYVAVNASEHIDVDAAINMCAYDLTATGDKVFKVVHSDVLNAVVKQYNHLDESAKSNPEKVAEFNKNSCFGNCYGNGVCQSDGCTCYSGYSGADCSIDTSVGPDAVDISYAGFCDLEVDDCSCFNVQTYDLFGDFYCGTKTRRRMTNKTYTTEDASSLGEFVDAFNGLCCAPEERFKRSAGNDAGTDGVFITEYDISISNDGVNFGKGLTVYVYDSTCQEYIDNNGTVTFSLKSGYCFLGGMCVTEFTSNGCNKCMPQINAYAWTSDCATDTPDNSPDVTVVAVAVSVSAALLIIIAIAVLLFIKTKFGKPKRSVGIVLNNGEGCPKLKNAWDENARVIFNTSCLNNKQ